MNGNGQATPEQSTTRRPKRCAFDPRPLNNPQAIFNKHDAKGKGFLSLAQLRHLLKDVGLNVETKDLKLLFGRIDHDATNNMSR